MRKRMVAALLAATMVLGLTACGGSDSGSDSKSEGDGKTVNVYVGSDLEGTLDDEIEAYKKVNPDAEIVKHVIPNNDYDDKIKVLLSGGADDVDVFWARTPAFANQYRSAGALEDISAFIDKSDVDMGSIDAELTAVSDENEGIYGLPIYSSCWMLFYNKELFDQAKVDYPTEQMTWDEYCFNGY